MPTLESTPAQPSHGGKVVVALAGRLPEGGRDPVASRFPMVELIRVADVGEVPEAARSAAVLLRARLSTSDLSKLLTSLPQLTWLHSASAGLDHVLIPEVLARNLLVTRTEMARAAPMAEFVLTASLALLKRLPELLASQRLKRWQRPAPGTLVGATVGVVGAGSIGRAVAKRFRAFDTRTIGIKATVKPLPEFDDVWGPDRLDELLREADVVVLACPLTEATRGLLGRRQFELMKPGAILVNVARGAVVVESELVRALQNGEIGGAALDVFETEPLPGDSPLWELANVIVSPHSSSAGPATWDAVVEEFLSKLELFVQGGRAALAPYGVPAPGGVRLTPPPTSP